MHIKKIKEKKSLNMTQLDANYQQCYYIMYVFQGRGERKREMLPLARSKQKRIHPLLYHIPHFYKPLEPHIALFKEIVTPLKTVIPVN